MDVRVPKHWSEPGYVWLSASAALGVLGMLAGIFELTRGHTSGILGILGGLMLTAICLVGLWRVGISK
jgi:hypothetical protein